MKINSLCLPRLFVHITGTLKSIGHPPASQSTSTHSPQVLLEITQRSFSIWLHHHAANNLLDLPPQNLKFVLDGVVLHRMTPADMPDLVSFPPFPAPPPPLSTILIQALFLFIYFFIFIFYALFLLQRIVLSTQGVCQSYFKIMPQYLLLHTQLMLLSLSSLEVL